MCCSGGLLREIRYASTLPGPLRPTHDKSLITASAVRTCPNTSLNVRSAA
jgi:hypothetical protein